MRGKCFPGQGVRLHVGLPARAVLHSVNRVTHTLTIFGKPSYVEHSVSIWLVSYEFQNLETLQPLERTRLHIKGLKFEMSFSISVQMRLRNFWMKKKLSFP